MIKSRFGTRAYLVFIIIIGFLIFPVYLIGHPDIVIKDRHGNGNSAPAMGLFLMFISLLFLFIYGRILYIIKIESQTILAKGLFKHRRIKFSDIQLINLFSREDFYWTAGSIGIATRIELNNGDNIVIADPFYRNIHTIKQVLAENFKEKIKPSKTQVSEQPILQTALECDFSKFAGSPYTSFNGFLFYGITISFFLMIIKNPHLKGGYWILIISEFIFYLGLGTQLNYFLLSNKRLVVKNHFLFWINKTYDIKDIAIVDFESPYRRSYAMRIVTNDFKSKLFCAGSLRGKKWNELKEKLKNLQIDFAE